MAFQPQWICGFDDLDNATASQDLNGAWGVWATIQTTTKRTGTSALQIVNASQNQAAGRQISPAIRDLCVTFAFRPEALTQRDFLWLQDAGGNQTWFRMNADGSIAAFNGGNTLLGTTAPCLTAATWHSIQLRVYLADSPNGIVTLLVNGVEKLALTTADTRGSGTDGGGYSKLFFSGNGTSYIDDVVFGPWDGSFPGDISVHTLTPAGQGSDAGFTAAGAATALEAVDESTSNGDTDYITAVDPAARHSFTLPAVPVSGDVVGIMVAHHTQTELNTRNVKPFVRKSGSVSLGTAEGVNVGYQQRSGQSFITNPDTGLPFTAGEVAGAEIGLELQ